MDPYILPGLSFLSSSQETYATAKPLSADFLKYQLSRTPTPKRFSRNANRTPRAHLDPETLLNEGNLNLTKTHFRAASELISHDVAAKAHGQLPRFAENDFTLNDAIREAVGSKKIEAGKDAPGREISAPNAQKDGVSLLETHVAVPHSSGSPAEKVVLKRPTKRHPLPTAPLVHEQRAALAEVQVNRQFSIPDDERPAQAKKQKQKRPCIARNLPVDELELAEERLVPYNAPPICEWNSEKKTKKHWLYSNIQKRAQVAIDRYVTSDQRVTYVKQV